MVEERFHAVGKRKTSVARVWLKPGNGHIVINRKPMDEFLTRELDKMTIKQPLVLTDNLGKLDILVNVRGGGITGQAGAIKHGIAKALVDMDPDLRVALKKADMLRRDSRIKERKKYGQRGPRARYQYSKR